MKDYNKNNLEDHPEYLDFVIATLSALGDKLKAEGKTEEEIQELVTKEAKKLGL